MSILVTLDIFSGRENPKFVLDDENERMLLSLVEADADKIRSNFQPAVLGYRGFHIDPIEEQDSAIPEILTADLAPRRLFVHDSPEAERFLMRAATEFVLPGDLAEYARQEQARVFENPATLRPQGDPKLLAVGCPPCYAVDAPAYNPGFWNTPARQPFNNCYNYANNRATNTFAQPGRATGKPITALSCGGVQPSAQSDGLKPAGNFSGKLNAGQGWYVALVVAPGYDYHWYRQDTVGCWSHKPGQTAARDTDNSGNKIADPKTCNRGPYTSFCSYMVTGNWVKIQ
ncbi:MAG: hypothetical protein ACK4U0_01910 [Mesorhizobium sp.]